MIICWNGQAGGFGGGDFKYLFGDWGGMGLKWFPHVHLKNKPHSNCLLLTWQSSAQEHLSYLTVITVVYNYKCEYFENKFQVQSWVYGFSLMFMTKVKGQSGQRSRQVSHPETTGISFLWREEQISRYHLFLLFYENLLLISWTKLSSLHVTAIDANETKQLFRSFVVCLWDD